MQISVIEWIEARACGSGFADPKTGERDDGKNPVSVFELKGVRACIGGSWFAEKNIVAGEGC